MSPHYVTPMSPHLCSIILYHTQVSQHVLQQYTQLCFVLLCRNIFVCAPQSNATVMSTMLGTKQHSSATFTMEDVLQL